MERKGYLLEYKPKIGAGELQSFYSEAGVLESNLIEKAFQNADKSIIARNNEGSIVGAIRSSFDGVYSLIWDLQVRPSAYYDAYGLKSALLTNLVKNLSDNRHNFIAAIVSDKELDFYRYHNLPYGDELIVTTTNPENHILWESPYLVRKNDKVTPLELESLFRIADWQEEANMAEQFTYAFNTAASNFTARNDHGALIGMVRMHFDGKIAMKWNLVVDPNYRNQGIGFKLLSNLLDFIIKDGHESYGLAVKHMVKNYQKLAMKPALGKRIATNNPRL